MEDYIVIFLWKFDVKYFLWYQKTTNAIPSRTCSLSMCPDLESNPKTIVYGMLLQSTVPPGQGN